MQSCPSTESQFLGEELIGKDVGEGTGDNEVLLYVGNIFPWDLLIPMSDG